VSCTALHLIIRLSFKVQINCLIRSSINVATFSTATNIFGIGNWYYLRNNFEKCTFEHLNVYTRRKIEEPYVTLILLSSLLWVNFRPQSD